MLVDDVKITVRAGNGGEGAHTFMGMKKGVRVGPTGGDGGRGGSIYFKASHNVSDLSQFQFTKEIKAYHGAPGMSKNHNGKNAEDITILVPVGTKIIEKASGDEHEVNDSENPLLIARGGPGELGSFRLAKVIKQVPSRLGDTKTLHLTLSLIADIGLIGLPNAGKSSLLKALTNAQPKIGDYQFTTLEPNLGVLNNLILADIPGLIEGASEGRGLGVKFLRHIEKTKILIHCISPEDEDPLKSYETVREEFKKYNEELLDKKELVVITKTDLISAETLSQKINRLKQLDLMTVSIHNSETIEKLKNKLLEITDK